MTKQKIMLEKLGRERTVTQLTKNDFANRMYVKSRLDITVMFYSTNMLRIESLFLKS